MTRIIAEKAKKKKKKGSRQDSECKKNPINVDSSKQVDPLISNRMQYVSSNVAPLSPLAAALCSLPEVCCASSYRWCVTDTQW